MRFFSFKRLTTFGLVCVSGGLVALLLFSFLSRFFGAADSVSHFRLYLLAGLLGTGLLCLLARRRRLVWTCLLGVGLGMLSVAGTLLHRPLDDPQAPRTVKLLQLNLYARNMTPEAVVAHVRAQQPDAIALQEVTPALFETVVEVLKADYPHMASCLSEGGTVAMSRLPLWAGEQGCRTLPGFSGLAYLTLQLGEQPVTLVSLHLRWPYPSPQRQHIDAVTQALSAWPHPLVMAGDFNAAPWSHAVRRMEAASRTQAVGGVRHTWFHRRGPGLPLDHVLLPASVRALQAEVGPDVGSDHRPVMVRLGF